MRVKKDRKIYVWPGLTTKVLVIGSSKLDIILSQNTENTRRIHTVHRENYGNLVNGIDSRRIKLSGGKDPERHPLGRCTIKINTGNSNDNTFLGKSQPDRNSVNHKKRSITKCTSTTSNGLPKTKKKWKPEYMAADDLKGLIFAQGLVSAEDAESEGGYWPSLKTNKDWLSKRWQRTVKE